MSKQVNLHHFVLEPRNQQPTNSRAKKAQSTKQRKNRATQEQKRKNNKQTNKERRVIIITIMPSLFAIQAHRKRVSRPGKAMKLQDRLTIRLIHTSTNKKELLFDMARIVMDVVDQTLAQSQTLTTTETAAASCEPSATTTTTTRAGAAATATAIDAAVTAAVETVCETVCETADPKELEEEQQDEDEDGETDIDTDNEEDAPPDDVDMDTDTDTVVDATHDLDNTTASDVDMDEPPQTPPRKRKLTTVQDCLRDPLRVWPSSTDTASTGGAMDVLLLEQIKCQQDLTDVVCCIHLASEWEVAGYTDGGELLLRGKRISACATTTTTSTDTLLFTGTQAKAALRHQRAVANTCIVACSTALARILLGPAPACSPLHLIDTVVHADTTQHSGASASEPVATTTTTASSTSTRSTEMSNAQVNAAPQVAVADPTIPTVLSSSTTTVSPSAATMAMEGTALFTDRSSFADDMAWLVARSEHLMKTAEMMIGWICRLLAMLSPGEENQEQEKEKKLPTKTEMIRAMKWQGRRVVSVLDALGDEAAELPSVDVWYHDTVEPGSSGSGGGDNASKEEMKEAMECELHAWAVDDAPFVFEGREMPVELVSESCRHTFTTRFTELRTAVRAAHQTAILPRVREYPEDSQDELLQLQGATGHTTYWWFLQD